MSVKEKENRFIDYNSIESREYQNSIAEKCVNKNSLVVIPTGLGKTIIALLVVGETLKRYPDGSKVIILAPTRPLINQHFTEFKKRMTLQEEKFSILTGMILPEKRTRIFSNKQILFYTPQTLRNDLVNKRYSLKKVCLIVFDEIHHGIGDYPYTFIAESYRDQNPDGNILGLTASPGSSETKIKSLCKNMGIPYENRHSRTRQDVDVKGYIKPMDIFKLSVEQTELMKDIYKVLKGLIEERLKYLSRLGFLESKTNDLYKELIRKDLLRLNKELVTIINSNDDKTGVYSAISINAQALILYHMVELIEQQGLDNLLEYMERLYKDALKKGSSKAQRILASEYKLHNVFLALKKNKEFNPEQLIHPKYSLLEKTVIDEVKVSPHSRILVFVKFRISVKNIVNRLKKISSLTPIRFVGQSTKSKSDKGMSQKQQIEILEQFKEGIYNVLVATNVGEEGLDIAECDMVIFYDVVASEIRFIQRKGRTARHRQGKVVILFTKGTNDEIYLNIVLNKLKKMNYTLKGTSEGLKKPLEKRRDNAIPEIPLIRKEVKLNSHNKCNDGQSNLLSFMANKSGKKHAINPDNNNLNPIIYLNKEFQMKLGLRKYLTDTGIPFSIIPSDIDINIANKIIMQLYSDELSSNKTLMNLREFDKKVNSKYSLVLHIINLFDFQETIEGEKHLLQNKFIRYGRENDIRIITIDNPEQLFKLIEENTIIKSLLT